MIFFLIKINWFKQYFSASLVSAFNNGTYYVAIQHNGTTYSSAVIVPTTVSVLMTINTMTLIGVNTKIVDVHNKNKYIIISRVLWLVRWQEKILNDIRINSNN